MTKEITIENFKAYLSAPDGDQQLPGLIIIHEVWGLNDHIKDVANRFAAQGYVVVAPDLLSQTGVLEKIDQSIMKQIHNPATRDEAQKKLRAAMAPIQSPEFGRETVVKLTQCVAFLSQQPTVSEKIAVVGFCFGGTYAYALAANQPNLAAIIPFYGHGPQEQELQKI